MNPSASGWISKLLSELEKQTPNTSADIHNLYFKLRDCGFIYGSNQCIAGYTGTKDTYTKEEICKVNLVIALLTTHNNFKSHEFTKSVIAFYTEINQYKASFFEDIINGKNTNSVLEKIIHKRVQTNDNFLTKNFNYFITNALMFVDVLAYQTFLKTGKITESYLQQLEAAIETITVAALNVKTQKTQYDESLIKLLESSLRYQKRIKATYQQAITMIHNTLEAQYILDIACMATWSDQVIDKNEKAFLTQLGADIDLDKKTVKQSIKAVDDFYTTNKDKIELLTSKNLVQSFYDNSSTMVSKLISRNSKRLLKELRESKELMVLLSKSTVKELTEDEQKKVQEQLIDVFKSIPSLAIFLLPGGALLLPLVVKFIPKLLPSAFDENRIDD